MPASQTSTAQRKKLIARIKGLLRTIADDLGRHPSHEKRGRAGKRLLWYWQIGQAANLFSGGSEDYGRRVIDRLAAEVGKGSNWIRAYQRFARYFTRREVNKAIQEGLSWRHIQALLLLQGNAGLRHRLWARAVHEGISGKQMFRLVRQEARRTDDPGVQRRARVIDSQLFHAAARRCSTLLRWLADVQTAIPESAVLTGPHRRRVREQALRAYQELEGLRKRLLDAFPG